MMRLPGTIALALGFALAAAQAQAPDPQNTIRMETTKGAVTFVLRTDIAPKHA